MNGSESHAPLLLRKTTEMVRELVPKSLRQEIYMNQHGLTLCRRRRFCPECGKTIIYYTVECSTFDMGLYINKDYFEDLLGNDFIHWPVETLFEEFEKGGLLLWKGEFLLQKGTSKDDGEVTISKSSGDEVIELVLSGGRFNDLQDVLDYTVDNFYADINSGDHKIEIRA
ncbi:hypothetical protein E0486_03880 [Flaviaesturariibacter aridisoli]|uniref:Uncharacterized protein n=2 Tax=Flaviaesturariibacter aridisoli TaxID=2545761 RepID=A0A4R4E534_9BACT|nr:hypothetical protein E0486_03880 [Flaviaesturariibacter aridisoli]